MRRFFFIFLAIFLTLQASAQSNEVAEDRLKWFEEARFGMFVHWGLYSILGGSYEGRTMPDTTLPNGKSWYAEWIQQRLEIPDDAYQALTSRFDPVHFDADAWIREAKNAGMKYFVITAKHHDGFALWDSDVSDFDIASTPFKRRDPLGELVEACKKYGLKYGFYYSHWQDWEHPQGAIPYWKPARPDKEFERYWKEKSLPQVRELIERYDPDLLWFDTWDNEAEKLITPERRDELINLVRTLSPKCLINGRIAMHDPGDDIDFLEMMDNDYPEGLQQKPWQTPATMNHTWAYHSKDFNWKSSGQMLRYLVANAAKGGNYLLNIGPMADGSLPLPGVRRLREMGAWMLTNGESVYATKPFGGSPETLGEGIMVVQKQEAGKKVFYVHLTEPLNGNKLQLPFPAESVESCRLLDSGEKLSVSERRGGIEMHLPDPAQYDNSIRVLKIIVSNRD